MAVDCTKFGFSACEEAEVVRGRAPVKISNFPKPVQRMRLVYQSFNQSVEEIYFFLLSQIKEDLGLPNVVKITDIFSATEQSSFWGQSQNRLSIQQSQVSNYMATIGKLTKEMFQIVRELTVMEERLDLYEESFKPVKAESARKTQAAETVLRSYWVDLKDGGVKSPGSIYGLGSSLGYTALPDLFFAAPPLKKNDIDGYVNNLKFNPKLKNVLRRKLKSYVVWKDHTYKEIKNRKNFILKFLRQHYNAIQMYISWIKPYLKNVHRLTHNMQRNESEDLIGAFEGSFIEIEVVFWREDGLVNPFLVLNLLFRTSPHMDYHQDGYQHKGPVHVGRSEFTLRGYAWTEEEFENYKKMRRQEEIDLIGEIDSSLKSAIDALGDDLRRYLKEAGETFEEDEKKKEEEQTRSKKMLENAKDVGEPFMAVFKGFKEVFEAFSPKLLRKKDKSKPSDWELENARAKAKKSVEVPLWLAYKNFKKGHKMYTW